MVSFRGFDHGEIVLGFVLSGVEGGRGVEGRGGFGFRF